MSELSIFQPAVCTKECVRSFALASEAPKISLKEEILILSRLMSATLGYNAAFWNYLKSMNTTPLSECEMMARRPKRRAFLERPAVSEGEHADFVSEAAFLFEQLDHYAGEFDKKRGMESGLKSLIAVAPAFIAAQESAQTKSFENGLPAVHYVNPYVALNVASTVLFDIFKSLEHAQPHRSPHDLQQAFRPLYMYVEGIREEYPVHLSPNVGVPAYKNDEVRTVLMGTYTSLEDHIRDVPDVDVEIARAAQYGFACVQNYLSPFVGNIAENKQGFEAHILTFAEWGPLVAASREKRAQREARQKLHPELYLPQNDF